MCVTGQTCVDGNCLQNSALCSAQNQTGACAGGQACLEGSCVDPATVCSMANVTGLCVTGQTCVDGNCLMNSALCSASNQTGACAGGEMCLEGSCVDPSTLCSMSNVTGRCVTGQTCLDGNCLMNGQLCSASNQTGACAGGDACLEGSCVDPASLCSMQNQMGLCPRGEVCQQGTCTPAAGCTNCTASESCLDGICRDNTLLCSTQNPTGLCVSGFNCVAGNCIDAGAGCSANNPTGICPAGELCNNGMCEPINQTVLCDDENPCTRDWFDFARNRCAHDAQSASCTDGNACTTDACVMGTCMGTVVGGCVAPPVIDPYVTPTNDSVLLLSGTKPAGSSIEINMMEAVPQNPDTTWQVTLNLALGENVYVIRSHDQGTMSATIEVRVVYDTQAPTTSLTPAGGVFLNGITVRAASDEAATVYYTTDGAEPTEHAKSFQSVKEFRVFDDTTLKFRALDLAGNWEAATVTASYEITGHGNGWAGGPPLYEPRINAGATVANGSIYMAGGSDGLAPQAGAFRFDPTSTSTTWDVLTSLPNGRAQLSLAALGDYIYAVGGENNGSPVGTISRLHTSASMGWENRAPMPSTRFGLVAVPYSGALYVFGGKTNGGAVLDNLEVYSPGPDSWSNQRAQMPRARYGFAAIEYGGKIYLVGGEDAQGTPISEVDIYDVAGDMWSAGAALPTPRSFASATLLRNVGSLDTGYVGIVVAGGRVVGGSASAKVEEYIIDDDAWRERSPLPAARHSGSSVMIIKGSAVDTLEAQHWFMGGQSMGDIKADTMVYTSSQDYVRQLAPMPAPRFMHAAAPLNGKIYFFGGRSFQEALQAWEFDPETETYAVVAPLGSFQNGLGAVAVDDFVYAVGGANSFGNAVATLRAFDPVQGMWLELQPMPTARSAPAVAAIGKTIYVMGGYNAGALQTFEMYDTATDTWTTGPVLPAGRSGAMAVGHNGDIYLIGGRDNAGSPVSSILRYRGGSWSTVGGTAPVAHGTALQIHDDQIDIFAGRDGTTLSGRVWSYKISAGRFFTPAQPNLLQALDFSAVSYINGAVYLLGGNGEDTPGPEGESVVQKLNGRCFNGVLDGREESGVEGADSRGGCPSLGYEHHDGLGGVFYNQTPPSTTSLQGALNACNHYYNTSSCRVACGGGCGTVTYQDACNCSDPRYRWNYTTSCYNSSLRAGDVESGGSCSSTRVGRWD